MAWFTPATKAVDLTPEEIRPEVGETSRIKRSLAVVGQSLDMFRGAEIAIENEIADREAAHSTKIAELKEHLREVRVSIEGFTANETILKAGMNPPDRPVAAPDAPSSPVERLVPRMARVAREMQEAARGVGVADLVVADHVAGSKAGKARAAS